MRRDRGHPLGTILAGALLAGGCALPGAPLLGSLDGPDLSMASDAAVASDAAMAAEARGVSDAPSSRDASARPTPGVALVVRRIGPLPRQPVTRAPSICGRLFCSARLPTAASSIALDDFDGDGAVDIAASEVGPRLADAGRVTLLRNVGNVRFANATQAAALAGIRAWSLTSGDLDADGDSDLVVGGVGEGDGARSRVAVYLNDGEGHFSEAPRPLAVDGVPLALSPADWNSDGIVDLALGLGGEDPDGAYLERIVYGRGDGTFDDAATQLDEPGFTWAMLPTDFTGDGRLDLLVGNDPEVVRLSRVLDSGAGCDGWGAFVRDTNPRPDWLSTAWGSRDEVARPLERSEAFPVFTAPGSTPMGIASLDVNGDAVLDYVATQVGDHQLFVSARGAWSSRGGAWGLHMSNSDDANVGWGVVAVDLDRNGREDLVMAIGRFHDRARGAGNQVFFHLGDRFSRTFAGHGLDLPGAWSSLAAADLDGDGDTDFVLGPQRLYLFSCDPPATTGVVVRNTLEPGDRHWLRLRLRGTVSNPDALGARVELRAGGDTLVREVTRGGSTMSSNDLELDFGLRDVDRVDARVRWPGGLTQELRDLPVDRRTTLVEPRWITLDPPRARVGEEVAVEVSLAPGEGIAPLPAGTRVEALDAVWTTGPTTAGTTVRGRMRVTGVAPAVRVSSPDGAVRVRRRVLAARGDG